MANIEQVASGIFFYEFDGDVAEANISIISGWISANLGEINNLIFTNFTGEDAVLGKEEQDILKHLYMASYYKKKSRNVIKSIGSSSGNGILSLKDEDNAIVFVNTNEVSKQFHSLSKSHMEEVNKLVYAYNSYQARPTQVVNKNMFNDVMGLVATGTGFIIY